MFSWRTSSASQPKQTKSPSTTSNVREYAFFKQLKGCSFKEKGRVKIKGTPFKGTVEEIVDDITKIDWQQNSPAFIRVLIDGATDSRLYMPRELKGTTK
jgi:hypothetical protein